MGYHKSQISFPGGTCEKIDRTPWDTALRECAEEIGLASGGTKLLGALDDVITMTSNYIISPFVVAIPWPYSLKIDYGEVDKVIEVPISALLDKNCWHQEVYPADGQAITAEEYHYQGEVIWGATARILRQFRDIWSQIMKKSKE